MGTMALAERVILEMAGSGVGQGSEEQVVVLSARRENRVTRLWVTAMAKDGTQAWEVQLPVELATEEQSWWSPRGKSLAVDGQGQVYVSDHESVRVLDPADGSTKRRYEGRNQGFALSADGDLTVMLLTGLEHWDGQLGRTWYKEMERGAWVLDVVHLDNGHVAVGLAHSSEMQGVEEVRVYAGDGSEVARWETGHRGTQGMRALPGGRVLTYGLVGGIFGGGGEFRVGVWAWTWTETGTGTGTGELAWSDVEVPDGEGSRVLDVFVDKDGRVYLTRNVGGARCEDVVYGTRGQRESLRAYGPPARYAPRMVMMGNWRCLGITVESGRLTGTSEVQSYEAYAPVSLVREGDG